MAAFESGRADHGFDKTSAAELRRRLTPLIRTQPYSERIAHKAYWVEPKLMAEIEYRAKSAAGKVRRSFSRGCGKTSDPKPPCFRSLILIRAKQALSTPGGLIEFCSGLLIFKLTDARPVAKLFHGPSATTDLPRVRGVPDPGAASRRQGPAHDAMHGLRAPRPS